MIRTVSMPMLELPREQKVLGDFARRRSVSRERSAGGEPARGTEHAARRRFIVTGFNISPINEINEAPLAIAPYKLYKYSGRG